MFIIILNECVKTVAILAIGQNRALGVVGIKKHSEAGQCYKITVFNIQHNEIQRRLVCMCASTISQPGLVQAVKLQLWWGCGEILEVTSSLGGRAAFTHHRICHKRGASGEPHITSRRLAK